MVSEMKEIRSDSLPQNGRNFVLKIRMVLRSMFIDVAKPIFLGCQQIEHDCFFPIYSF